MEALGLHYVLGPALGLGVPGILFVVWYFSSRLQDKTLQAYREDTKKLLEAHKIEVLETQASHKEMVHEILTAYKQDMTEQRRMYESNVMLVKSWEKTDGEQRSVLVANTQAIQRLTDTLQYNRLCPNITVAEQR